MTHTPTAIPCKRPKVAVVPRNACISVECRVPGCTFVYDALVKVDAEEQARWHRQAHRGAVPDTRAVHDVEWDVYCSPCGGHRRTFGTRVDAQAWVDYHLSTEHGLVTCP